MRAAAALKCHVNNTSIFERKHYFYQDLPLGFQITQQRFPIAEKGYLAFSFPQDSSRQDSPIENCRVSVERIQIEQDSGKTLHDMIDLYSLVDLNRAGMSLIEIVFAPDLSTPEQAAGALRTVRDLLRHINICDGNLENGSLRCDVNISVEDTKASMTKIPRVEVKNMNSMQRVVDASYYEIARQIETMSKGDSVKQETRGFDPVDGKTFVMRVKETAMDYRYFPDPDLPPLHLTDDDISAIRNNLPELPHETESRLLNLGLNSQQIYTVVSSQALHYFEDVLNILTSGHESTPSLLLVESAFKWATIELLGRLNVHNLSFAQSPVNTRQLADIITAIHSENITVLNGKEILSKLFEEGLEGSHRSVGDVIEELGMKMINEPDILYQMSLEALQDPKSAKNFNALLNGDVKKFEFFFGKVIFNSGRKANPRILRQVLNDALDSLKKSS